MFPSIRVNGYRGLEGLQLDCLTPINLLVGKNNSGKSSLLECLWILANGGQPGALLQVLRQRGEFSESLQRRPEGVPAGRISYQVRHLFRHHRLDTDAKLTIEAPGASLEIGFERGQESMELRLFPFEEAEEEGYSGYLRIRTGGAEFTVPLQRDGSLDPRSRRVYSWGVPVDNVRYITTGELDYNEIAGLWDSITLTPREDQVLHALQILEPDLERLSFTARQRSSSGILIKLKGHPDPVPLGSTGDGVRRVLGLVASAVTTGHGVLLVDEIDTGLHYSTLVDLWLVLMRVCREVNTQIFATTHSLDCLRALDAALRRERNGARMAQVIRLTRGDHTTQPTIYPPEEVAVAMAQEIEVR
ncbi:MAG: AAA family ATPase [Candidatus Eremiobacterota bacterium]